MSEREREGGDASAARGGRPAPEWLAQLLSAAGVAVEAYLEDGQLFLEVLDGPPPRLRVSAFPIGARKALIQQAYLGWAYRALPEYPSAKAEAVCRGLAQRLESSQAAILALFASPSLQPEWSAELAMDAELLSRSQYVDYPRLVNVESFAFCPARCTFCTYPDLERVGTRMSDRLLYKVLADLEAIPKTVPFGLLPFGMSEPLAERRLDDILAHAERSLPNALVEIITTANLLVDGRLARLLPRRNLRWLRVSLNFTNAAEYEAEMGLSWDSTWRNVQRLHEVVASGEARFRVLLNRVRSHDERDDAFAQFAQMHLPLFEVRFSDRHGWLGRIPAPARDHDALACSQWYELTVAATGKVPLCCQDTHIEHSLGDASTTPLLEIYNQPALRARRAALAARGEFESCRGCGFPADGLVSEVETVRRRPRVRLVVAPGPVT